VINIETLRTNRDIRERILDAAEKLFSRLSYSGLRMQILSDHMGLSRKTLYNHFPGGKREIWRSCVERELRSFADRLAEIVDDARGDYVERGGQILDIGQEAVEQFYGPRGLISSGEDQDYFFPELKNSYVTSLSRFFREGVQKGLLREHLPVRSLAEMMMVLVTAWGKPDSSMMEGEVKSLTEFVESVMFFGMLSDEGRRQSGRITTRHRGGNTGKGRGQ